MNSSTLSLISVLKDTPEAIQKKQLQILSISDGITIMELNASQRKNKALYEVFEEKTSDGKPLYSNEAKRDIAVDSRLSQDSSYQVIISEISRSKNDLRKAQIDLEFLQNTLSSHKKIADLFCSED